MPSRILVVEDDASLRSIARHNLEEHGYEVVLAADGAEGLSKFESESPDAVLSDIRMPGMDGSQLLDELVARSARTPVILMTAYGTVDQAVAAMKRGATDYLTKPVDWDELLLVVERALEHRRLLAENSRLKSELRSAARFESIIGASDAIVALVDTLGRLTHVDSTVLVQGESGCGKELVARALHFQGARADGPFVAVNCGAIPRNLLEAELFGHEKGAFTGAQTARPGAFERASGGTLFLDEVAEIPVDAQPALLRALSEGTLQRVGGASEVPFDVRVVAATNRDLKTAVEDGDFREDLYFRLAVVPVSVPPLRSRGDDVLLIARHFLHELGRSDVTLTPAAETRLRGWSWPGNVRELKNVIERAAVLAREPGTIGADDLTGLEPAGTPAEAILRGDFPADGIDLTALERECIVGALEAARHNQTKAAALLGISRQTLIYRIQKHGLR